MKFKRNSQEENQVTPHISGVREKIEKRMNMAGKTVSLLPAARQVLERMGKNIKKARLRRNIRADTLSPIDKDGKQRYQESRLYRRERATGGRKQ